MKEIELKNIIKIQRFKAEIFDEEDQDFPNRRITAPKERAIDKILDRYTIEEKTQILKDIEKGSFDINDYTYQPICDLLRSHGFVIINKEG